MKSRSVSWVGQVSRIQEDEMAYKTAVGNPAVMRPREKYGEYMRIILKSVSEN
jgi:hypothetical protein